MIVENTFDEVLMAAVLGLQPEAEEIDRVAVPPGEDAEDFSARVLKETKAIVAAHRDGRHGDARSLVATAQQQYRAAWPTPTPIQADVPAQDDTVDLAELGDRIFRK